MNRSILSVAAVASMLALGLNACDDDEDGPSGPAAETYIATLTGAGESPAVSTPATGTTVLTVNADQTISWTMDLQGIRNMTASHIHGPGAAGVNAPVRANLFIPTATVSATLNGRVASGQFGPANVSGITYDSLLVIVRNGNAYVNIHTNDGVAPTNSGPGDFPGGEIRGQIVRQ